MSLADIMRNAVATVHGVVGSLEPDVTLEPWIGQDVHAKPIYDDPVTLTAIVERKSRLIAADDGSQKLVLATLTIITPVAANGAANRDEPIDPRDRFTLPGGQTGPIVDVQSIDDAGFDDGRGFYYQVLLGKDERSQGR